MSSVNKVILVGNLAADPEVRYTNSGAAVANFRMATNESWTDKSGNREQHTEWHRVVAWGKLGELCGQYLKKGRQVYIEGKIRNRSWETKEGDKRYTTEINANSVVFLGGRQDAGISTDNMDAAQYSSGPDASVGQQSAPPQSGNPFGADDDVPF